MLGEPGYYGRLILFFCVGVGVVLFSHRLAAFVCASSATSLSDLPKIKEPRPRPIRLLRRPPRRFDLPLLTPPTPTPASATTPDGFALADFSCWRRWAAGRLS